MRNTVVWFFWFLTTLLFIFSTRNPLYLGLILVGLLSLGYRLNEKDGKTAWLTQNFTFLAILVFISSLVNGLFTHSGTTVLLNFPNEWILIGGTVTLESLVYGATNGLSIGVIFLLFRVINLALSVKQLTRLIPRAFYPIGMIISISLTFFPTIQRRFREIKEAQIIRGNPMKKIRDWLPILIPLLVSSLENGLILSESMTSRGFYAVKTKINLTFPIIGIIFGTFSIFSGWILAIYNYPIYCYLPLYILGGFIIFINMNRMSGNIKTTTYHKEKFNKEDILVIGITTFFALILGIYLILGRLTSLSYTPYPSIEFPKIQLIPIILTLLSFVPFPFISDDQH